MSRPSISAKECSLFAELKKATTPTQLDAQSVLEYLKSEGYNVMVVSSHVMSVTPYGGMVAIAPIINNEVDFDRVEAWMERQL